MKNEHYILENGVLEIQEQTLIVDDVEKKQWKTELLWVSFFLLLGGAKLWDGIKKDDYFKMFLGIAMLVLGAFSLWVNRVRITTQAEIPLTDIVKIEINTKKPDKWIYGRILLKNKKVRIILINEEFDKARFIEDLRPRDIQLVLK